MEGAKAAVGSCTLATGVKDKEGVVHKDIVFRELAGPEEDLLGSRKTKVSNKIHQILANCCQKIGTVEDRPTINDMVKKMVGVDRWLYLFKLRTLSLGKEYQFQTTCPQCGTEDKVLYDLEQIKVIKAPDAEKLIQEDTLPSGRTVRWRIADGGIEATIENNTMDDRAMTVALHARITELDDKPPSFTDVKGMSLRDRAALRKIIEEKEGQVDDEYDAVCPKCGHEYRDSLPMDPVDFFGL